MTTDTAPPLAPNEAIMGATILRRSGTPALAYWDRDRRRWRLAVCWPDQPVRRFDDFASAALDDPGCVSPYGDGDGA